MRAYHLIHVDKSYIRNSELNPERLSARLNVTLEVRKRLPAVAPRLAEMQRLLGTDHRLAISIGPRVQA